MLFKWIEFADSVVELNRSEMGAAKTYSQALKMKKKYHIKTFKATLLIKMKNNIMLEFAHIFPTHEHHS